MSEWRGALVAIGVGLLGAGAILTGCGSDDDNSPTAAEVSPRDKFSAAMTYEGYADNSFTARVMHQDLCDLEADPVRQRLYLSDTLGVGGGDYSVSYILTILNSTGCGK